MADVEATFEAFTAESVSFINVETLSSQEISLVKRGYVKVDSDSLLDNDWCTAKSSVTDKQITPGRIDIGPICQSTLKDGVEMVVPFTKPVMAGCLDDDSDPYVWTPWLDISDPSAFDSSRLQLTIDIENSQILIIDKDTDSNHFT